jgi:hypothetical protein
VLSQPTKANIPIAEMSAMIFVFMFYFGVQQLFDCVATARSTLAFDQDGYRRTARFSLISVSASFPMCRFIYEF